MIPLDESQNAFPGGNSEVEPPDPISNSEVKRFSADGSVGSPHVRVGHCQDLTPKIPGPSWSGYFFVCDLIKLKKSTAYQATRLIIAVIMHILGERPLFFGALSA